jgi:hypothetical protein
MLYKTMVDYKIPVVNDGLYVILLCEFTMGRKN